MNIAILLKSKPCTDEAGRVLQIAEDTLGQGHALNLYLLQEAVRFCHPISRCSDFADLETLIGKGLKVFVLTSDAKTSRYPPLWQPEDSLSVIWH